MEDFVTRNLSGGGWALSHDALHMSQLQATIAQAFGLLPSVFWAHVIFLVLGCASTTP